MAFTISCRPQDIATQYQYEGIRRMVAESPRQHLFRQLQRQPIDSAQQPCVVLELLQRELLSLVCSSRTRSY